MKRQELIGLDFEVDKLTNSIENIVAGDSFATDISIISITDLKKVTKKMVGSLIGDWSSCSTKRMFSN